MKRYIIGITIEESRQIVIEETGHKDVISAINTIKSKEEYKKCKFDFIYSEEIDFR